MTLNIPQFKCLVDLQYLTDGKQVGFIEAYCFAVTCLVNRPLLFTVHTIHGAVYARLPINALYHKFPDNVIQVNPEKLDPWGTIGKESQVIQFDYLKEYEVETLSFDVNLTGRYMFSIDYLYGAYAQDPEQHKFSHIIALDNGQIAALPNNYLKFIDEHFVDKDAEPSVEYQRNLNYYRIK